MVSTLVWLMHHLNDVLTSASVNGTWQVKKEIEQKKKSSSLSKQIKTEKGTTKKETKLQKSFNICAQDFNSYEIRK